MDDLIAQLDTLNWKEPVPDELQSEVRMRFNEALAGGPNMNGDAGPTLTVNHAIDCLYATDRIEKLEAENARLKLIVQGYVDPGQVRADLAPFVNEINSEPFVPRATLSDNRGG